MNVTALAVIIDSAVTIGVGWRLNRTAKREVSKAVKDIEPAIRSAVSDIAGEQKKEIAKLIQSWIPLIVKKLQNAPGVQLRSNNDRVANSESTIRSRIDADTKQ
jgi:hypothetical protein